MQQIRILNLGAGVQSTTVYLMYMTGGITPTIDYAIFADTGEEPKMVYDHLRWLQSLNGPPILVRSVGRLGDDLIRGCNSTGGRFVTIPAFTANEEGRPVGMSRRQCTREYKIAVIERCIRSELLGLRPRQRVPRGIVVSQAYGISCDEAGRAIRIRERLKSKQWIVPVFPLLDLRMTRGDCLAWLRRFSVPHEVPKSSCVFCPFRSNAEWRWLRNTDPEGWKRACDIDRALRVPGNVVHRNPGQQLYIHRSCVPLEKVDFGEDSGDPRQYHLGLNWIAECAGMCGI